MSRIVTAKSIVNNKSVRQKVLFTIAMLALYRLLVFVPVPFADIAQIIETTNTGTAEGLSQFLMLLGGSIERFSLLSVGLAPFINASIIIQLLTVVVPKLEELQEMGEQGTKQIQQYMRYATFPLALLQSLGMVYIINSLVGGTVIDTANFTTVLMAAFSMSVGAMILIWMGDLITEKGITNGVSLLIFASIVAGMTMQINASLLSTPDLANFIAVLAFILIVIIILIIGSVSLLRSMKNIPVVYARQGKVEQTSTLPIPLNPVGMIPIIFAIAFVTFPYLLGQFLLKIGTPNTFIYNAANWASNSFNYYVANPSWFVIIANFVFIVLFTFFYTLIVFNPDKMADNIQKRGGFIPGIRPGNETAAYINKILTHLSFWGGIGLGFLGIFDKLIYKIPFIIDLTSNLGTVPIVVTGSGVVIIVGVVQELSNKINTEVLMSKYDKI